MQSLNQLNGSLDRETQPPPHPTPVYIEPKILSDEIEIEEILETADPIVSYNDLPKFVSIKHMDHSHLSDRVDQSQFVFGQTQTRLLMDNKTILQQSIDEKGEQDNSLVTLLKVIIWVCYFFSSAELDFTKMSFLHTVDFIGIGLASLYVLFKVISTSGVGFQEILHITSLATTVSIHLYLKIQSQDALVHILLILRSLRLFFPISLKSSIKFLVLKTVKQLKNILKVSAPLAFIIIMYSIAFNQGAYSSIHNRCRKDIGLSQVAPPTDSMLCGSRQCPDNLKCLNPQTYNIAFGMEQFQTEQALAYGFFVFKNLYRSIFTMFSLGTLSQSAKIISIYVNALPGYLVASLSISSLLLIQLAFIPILIILIENRLDKTDCQKVQTMIQECQSKEQLSETKAIPAIPISSEGYTAAPTFGQINNESGENKKSRSNKKRIISNQSDKRLSICSEIEKNMQKSLKFPQINQQINEESASASEVPSLSIQAIFEELLLIFKVTLAITHWVLLVIFSLRLTDQKTNQSIGIGIFCIFIVWTFKVFMAIFNKYFDDQTQEECDDQISKDNQQLIFKIECFVYLINLLDYLCRMLQHVYIMEEPSALTALATASLTLRVFYIPLTSNNYTSFCNQLKMFFKMQSSILVYIFFMLVVSSILATFTIQFSGDSFQVGIIKHFLSFSNGNWLQIYSSPDATSVDFSSGLEFAIKFILVIGGEIVLLKLIYSEAIATGILETCWKQIKLPEVQLLYKPTPEEVIEALKSQKTFFLLPYEPSSLRQSLHRVQQRSTYKNFKEKLIETYLLISFVGEIIIKESSLYIYSLMAISCLLLFDAALSILARRFWGKYSFSNYHWYNIANLIVSFIIIANAIQPFIDCAFLRVIRVMLLVSSSNHPLKEAYNLFYSFFRVFSKLLVLFGILWAFFCIICIGVSMQSHKEDQTELVLKSSALALQMFKKGFDLSSALLISHEFSTLFSIQGSVCSLLIGIPFNCMCIVFMLKYLQEQCKKQEGKEMKQLITQSRSKLRSEQALENLEKNKIREQILSLHPKISPEAFLQKGFLLELVSKNNSLYQSTKIVVCALSYVLLVCVGLFQTTASVEQLLSLKLARLFFFVLQIALFLVQSLAFEGTGPYFKIMLGIYAATLPGCFIMMIPFHSLIASKALSQLLLLFISLAPFSFINVFLTFNNEFKSLASYFYKKMSRSLWLLLFVLIMGWFFSSILSLFLKQQMIVILSKVLICFLGGTYQPSLHLEQTNSYDTIAVYIIASVINLVSFVVRNGLIALIFFEVSDKINQKMSPVTGPKITRKYYRTLFEQNKFMEIWSHLDIKGTGLLPYSVLFHQLPNFIKAFKLYKRYLEFVVAPKADLFSLKIELFRQLQLPVRTVNILDGEGNKWTQYMISMFDVVARMLCLAIKEYEKDNEQSQQRQKKPQQKRSCKFVSHLEFNSEQWNKSIAVRVNQFNKQRKEELQIEERYIILKAIDMESRHLGSIIKILPALRRKISEAKEKVKTQ